ncbi:unnamed protein product, partial [marine sediment metagenome]
MRWKLCVAWLVVLMASTWSVSVAEEEEPPTLERSYLGLSRGPLRQAKLVDLPPGTLLHAGSVVVTEEQVMEQIARADEQFRAQLDKNRFYVLEQLGVRALLLGEAQEWARMQQMSTIEETPASLIETYLQSIAGKVRVSDEEIRVFFEKNKNMFGGASLEQVAQMLKPYVLSQKQDEVLAAHVNALSKRYPVELAAQWVKTQARASLDNPVDKARRSGTPTVVDFGAQGCGPCDMMTPILEELRQEYA